MDHREARATFFTPIPRPSGRVFPSPPEELLPEEPHTRLEQTPVAGQQGGAHGLLGQEIGVVSQRLGPQIERAQPCPSGCERVQEPLVQRNARARFIGESRLCCLLFL